MTEDTPSRTEALLAGIIKWLRAEKPESVEAYPHRIGLPKQEVGDKPAGFLFLL